MEIFSFVHFANEFKAQFNSLLSYAPPPSIELGPFNIDLSRITNSPLSYHYWSPVGHISNWAMRHLFWALHHPYILSSVPSLFSTAPYLLSSAPSLLSTAPSVLRYASYPYIMSRQRFMPHLLLTYAPHTRDVRDVVMHELNANKTGWPHPHNEIYVYFNTHCPKGNRLSVI